MPFKSEAQRKKMNMLAAQGKIKQSVVDEFNSASKGMKLPERITPKKIKPIKSLDELKARAKKLGT